MFREKAEQVAEMLEQKNVEYNSAYDSDTEFIRTMYPDGIPVDQYDNIVLCVRVFDLMKKLTNGGDPARLCMYLAGYGILGMLEADKGE